MKKQFSVDSDLYCMLLEWRKVYKADLSDLVNVCIEALNKGRPLTMYKRPENIQTVIHTFYITKENLYALEQMRASYGIRMSLLVNIAIAYLCKPDAGTDASI